MSRYWRGLRRCGFGNIWLLVCTSYIALTLYISKQQSQHGTLLEVRRRLGSKVPTTKQVYVPGPTRNEMHRPVIYQHLTMKPTTVAPEVKSLIFAVNSPERHIDLGIQQGKIRSRQKESHPAKHETKSNNTLSSYKDNKAVLEAPANKPTAVATSSQQQKKMENRRRDDNKTSLLEKTQVKVESDKIRRSPDVHIADKNPDIKVSNQSMKVAPHGMQKADTNNQLKKNEVAPAPKPTPKEKQEVKEQKGKPNQKAKVKDGHKTKERGSIPLPSAPPGFLGVQGKTIVLWTNLTAKRPMWNFKTWSLKKCPYKCQITNDRSYLSQASLVLFRLRMLQTTPDKFLREFVEAYDITDLPRTKYPHQVWVDVNQESPMYSHSDEELAAVDNYIDYVVSYHSQSDFTYDYRFLYRKRKTPLPSINYAANKTKTVLWYVSHCEDHSGRWRYVKELMKHNVSIDIYGKCTGMKDGCEGYKDLNCVNALKSQYKFYLAFENSICSEYITEKFWNILNSSSGMYNIPIALGARLDEYERLSPHNSFLHVRNFTGAKDLAQYIHKIDSDDSKFNSYHTWRQNYETFVDKREKFDCWLCRMAYQQPPAKRTSSYSKFWSRQKLCDQKPEPI